MSDYEVLVALVAHLNLEHHTPMTELSRRFKGKGRHFWVDVKAAANEAYEASKRPTRRKDRSEQEIAKEIA